MFTKTFSTFAILAVCLLQLVSAERIPAQKRYLKSAGIVYSPYKGPEGKSSCKTPQEVGADIEKLKTYGLIRLYGLDCQQVQNVLPHAKKFGIQLMVGIHEVHKLTEQVNMLGGIVKGDDWKMIRTIMIGNELLLGNKKLNAAGAPAGAYNAGEVHALTTQGRTLLRAKGFQGPVVTANIFYQVLQNPSLCNNNEELLAINLHPFFDGAVKAEGAGAFAKEMVKQIKDKPECKDKKVLITEIGWPHTGNPNKAALPGRENQKKAINSLKQLGNDYILFTAFDDPWKADDPNTFNAEKFWGIL